MSSSNPEAKVDMPRTGGAASANGPPDRHATPKPAATSPAEVDATLTELEQRQAERHAEQPKLTDAWAEREDAKSTAGKPAKTRRPDLELRVLRRMLALLDELPSEAAKRRTVEWLSDRYNMPDDGSPPF